MIIAKHFDPVIGIDVHIVQPPGPVPPVPVPHPFVGMLFDSLDYLPYVGMPVTNGIRPVCTAGSSVRAPPHFPIGGVFVKPPGNEGEVFMGSATVLAGGDPLSSLGMRVLSCQDVGMPAPFRMGPFKKTKQVSLMLPTSVAICIPGGALVLVGGPPTISMKAMITHGVGAALSHAAKAAGRFAFGKFRFVKPAYMAARRLGARGERAAEKLLGKAADVAVDAAAAYAQKAVEKFFQDLVGLPVDVARGVVFADAVDVDLPGPLPLRWERTWHSASPHDGHFGPGWHHTLDVALAVGGPARVGPRVAVVRLADGRAAAFAMPAPGEPAWNARERAWLRHEADGLVFETRHGLRHHFGPPPADARRADPWLPLLRVSDAWGNAVALSYDARGTLRGVVDSAGRRLAVATDERGRITEIRGPHPTMPGVTAALAGYRYSTDGDLAEARDALGHALRYGYDAQHRLVEETDRLGMAFHFAYVGAGPMSRCVRTWAAGGVFDYRIDGDDAAQTSRVTHPTGAETQHDWNALGVVTRRVDALGAEHLYDYDDDGRLLAETDPLGGTTTYARDDFGRLLAVTDAFGLETTFGYDAAGRLAAFTDADGHAWTRATDGGVATTTDPEGGTTRVERDARGLVTAVTDALGATTRIAYDAAGNATHVRDRTGAVREMSYDALGRLVRTTDAMGGVTRVERDACGRVTSVRNADGGVQRIAYDAAGNVTSATDDAGRTRRFVYGPLVPHGALERLVEPDGAEARFAYDARGALAAAGDASGRRWRFARDAAGRVTAEEDTAGHRLHYAYDAAGRLAAVTDARGQTTAFEHDALGRLTARRAADGTAETFVYTPAGRLRLAIAPGATARFAYDGCGRMVEETLGKTTVATRYDAAGRRTARTLTDGRSIAFTHDAEGRLAGVEVLNAADSGEALSVRITRDASGRETERALPGGHVGQTRHSAAGQPIAQRLLSNGTPGPTLRYDDAPGDGASGAPARETGAWTLTYDPDGRLVSKHRADTDLRFHYDAAGRLARAERDGTEVARFVYDALGRRVRTVTPETTTETTWDGERVARERIVPAKGSTAAAADRQAVWDGSDLVAVLDAAGADLFAVPGPAGAAWLADAGGGIHDTLPPGHAPDAVGLIAARRGAVEAETQVALQPDPLGLFGGLGALGLAPGRVPPIVFLVADDPLALPLRGDLGAYGLPGFDHAATLDPLARLRAAAATPSLAETRVGVLAVPATRPREGEALRREMTAPPAVPAAGSASDR